MSSSAEVYYERANRRRELYEARVRNTVIEHLSRYEELLDDLRQQGLDTVVAEEFAEAEFHLEQARAVLDDNVEAARSLSFEVGNLLRGLPAYARSQRRAMAKAERAAVNAERAATLAERTAAQAERAAARRAALASELRERRVKLSAEAEQARGAAAEALQALVARIDAVTQEPQSGTPTESAESVETVLKAVEETEVQVAVDEELRKETMRVLAETMRRLGFASEAPVWQGKWIRLRFRNLAGEQALFLVGGDGAMKYSFSGYQGMACKKDRDRVRSHLAEVYGVKFSDRRVIGENPDEIEKSHFSDERPESAGR